MYDIDKINFYLSKKGKNRADLSRALGLSNSIYQNLAAKTPAFRHIAAPAASEGAKKAPDPEIEGKDEKIKLMC